MRATTARFSLVVAIALAGTACPLTAQAASPADTRPISFHATAVRTVELFSAVYEAHVAGQGTVMDYFTQESTATSSPTSAANYEPHQAVSNAFVPILENNGTTLSMQNRSSGTADLLADVEGYFA